MKHIGNLMITKENAGEFAALNEVTGYLSIRADAQLPALTSVGGHLYIRADAQLPALTSVGGHLYIRADAQLPVLTSVGGYLDISADAQLPVLRIAHGVDGSLIAVKMYGLWRSTDGLYYAGCKGPLTLEQARELAPKWGDQDVAQTFMRAIEACEAKS